MLFSNIKILPNIDDMKPFQTIGCNESHFIEINIETLLVF